MVKLTTKTPVRAEREKNFMIYCNTFLSSGSTTYLHSGVFPPKHLRHRGIAHIWAVIFLFLLILLVGLSLDTARVCLVAHELHNAADAAALAGAVMVKADRNGAREQAQMIAQQNFADSDAVLLDLNIDNDPNGDIVIGWYNREEGTFTPAVDESDAVNAMAVIASRTQQRGGPVSLIFGPIADVNDVNVAGRWQDGVGPYAIAMAVGGTGAGLIALAPTEPGLYMNGNFTLHVEAIPPAPPGDGEVQINSESWNALDVDGNSTQIEASALNIWGGLDVNHDLYVPYTTGAPPIPDPLAWLPPPDYSTLPDLTAETKLRIGDTSTGSRITVTCPDPNGNPHEFYPGYYSGGFYINSDDSPGNPSVHFNPGIYILGGCSSGQIAGLVMYGSSRAVSDEAMFYITGDGIVDIHGNGGIQATPPTSGTYEGVTIFQDRANTNEAYINGTSELDLQGTIYFPSADPVNLRGGGWGFGNQLIGYRFDIRGQGIVGVRYDGRNRAPVTRSFIVE